MTGQEVVRELEIFCSRHGVSLPFKTEPIFGGRNSQVFKLSNGDSQWILKKYSQPVGSQRDRLGTEFNFLVLLNKEGVAGIPQPLGMDRDVSCALYTFLPGNRPKVITSTHICQAASFIVKINRFPELSSALAFPLASDACLSWQDHLALTEFRIYRLLNMKPDSAVELDAYSFILKHLVPIWLLIKAKLLQDIPPTELIQPLTLAERILSPSDFGFHNTLEHEGRLSFVDFEYAGWDDPAKLICDFFCQPELPINEKQGRQFMDNLLNNWPSADAVFRRVDRLLPVHLLKWCCILLNEFRAEDRERRMHAGVKAEGLLADQLGKAKSYFSVHLAHLT